MNSVATGCSCAGFFLPNSHSNARNVRFRAFISLCHILTARHAHAGTRPLSHTNIKHTRARARSGTEIQTGFSQFDLMVLSRASFSFFFFVSSGWTRNTLTAGCTPTTRELEF